MRQIALDTETTGLEPKEGHRIIEIGCVELVNRRLTGNSFHQYINPQREVEQGALAVHGISNEFLADKPTFSEIVTEFLAFIKGAELIIHNAKFDIGFINHELKKIKTRLGKVSDYCSHIDTLALARDLHPGQRNNLDALCKRYNVDNSGRDLHGALLDADILALVYLAMTGGQISLFENIGTNKSDSKENQVITPTRKERQPLTIITANDEELIAHQKQLELINKASDGQCLWLEK